MFSSLKIQDEEINQVLNIEKPHEFRKSKFDSIIFSMMAVHSDELREVEKEIRQVETKLKEELREAENERHQVEIKLYQVETKLKDELREAEKEKHQVEIKLKDELREAEKEKHQVEIKLKDELNDKNLQVEKLTIAYIKSKGELNVRGALEYCRAKILSPNLNYHFQEPFDKAFKELDKNKDFIEILAHKCEQTKIREIDVIRCVGGLYHNSSKDFHGHHFDAVEIVTSSWTPAEVVALASIFTLCQVPYVVLDALGKPVDNAP